MFFINNPTFIKILFAAVAMIISVGCCTSLYKGQPSDHFNGKYFYNKEPEHSFSDMLKWMREMKTVEWPEWIDDPQQPWPPMSVKDGEIRVTYINHATILIQTDGLNILTDPIWSERAGPFS